MMSGALQVAVLESLEGKWGLRGWRLVSVFLFTSPPFFLSRPFPLHLQSNCDFIVTPLYLEPSHSLLINILYQDYTSNISHDLTTMLTHHPFFT